MLKACQDCIHLGSYGGTSGAWSVECHKQGRMHVVDISEHLRSYVCDHFEGRFLQDAAPRAVEAFESARKHGSPELKGALDRWFAGPPNDVNVTTNRGLPLLSVADGNLETFEHDKSLKSYKNSNHMFADIFGAVEVQWPIILFLSQANPPGIQIETIDNSSVSVVYLGYPYSLAEITAAFSSILSKQGIELVRPWFIRELRSLGINANDPSFSSFVSLPAYVSAFLNHHGRQLLRAHTLVLVQENPPDLNAVADDLGLDAKSYGVIWCDARKDFHLSHHGETKYDFAGPSELTPKLVSVGVSAVLATPSEFLSELWRRLPPNAFEPFPTVIFFNEAGDLQYLNTLEAIKDFKRLPLRSDPRKRASPRPQSM